jgi:hypothetical protein
MGVFDTVMLRCPRCGTLNEYQSKGACQPIQQIYTFPNVPPAVFYGITPEAMRVPCKQCGWTCSGGPPCTST